MGFCFLAVFFAPILYSQITDVRNRKRLLPDLNKLAIKHSVTIHEFEYRHNFAIGMDKISHRLLYIDKHDDLRTEYIADLSKYHRCMFYEKRRNVKYNKTSLNVIDQIALKLVSRNPVDSDTTLVLYNGLKGAPLGREYFIAKYWSSLINSQLNTTNLQSI
jgi:hypothetical protein